jgi:hypothetical protein
LTIAILVFFFVFVLRPALARLFRLVLARLVVVLALPMLAGLTTLLALSGLAALLTFLLHIVSHKNLPPYKKARGLFRRLLNLFIRALVAAKVCKGWEELVVHSNHKPISRLLDQAKYISGRQRVVPASRLPGARDGQ